MTLNSDDYTDELAVIFEWSSLLYAHILYGLRTTLANSCPSYHAACTLLQWLNVPVSSYVEAGVLHLLQCVNLSLNNDDHIFVPK
jgi:hypothetical protein